jgi:hypothetical protein
MQFGIAARARMIGLNETLRIAALTWFNSKHIHNELAIRKSPWQFETAVNARGRQIQSREKQ